MNKKPPHYQKPSFFYNVDKGIVRKRKSIILAIPPILINAKDKREALQIAKLYATCHGLDVAVEALCYWYWTEGILS